MKKDSLQSLFDYLAGEDCSNRIPDPGYELDKDLKYSRPKRKQITSSSLPNLSITYEASYKLLTSRIKEIEADIKKLSANTEDPAKEPYIVDLKDRLKPLKIMRTEVKEILEEIQNYYIISWWRSELYTMNSRKQRRHRYVEPQY